MKRTLSLLLAIALILVSIPFAASAASVITVSTPAQFLAIRNDLTANYQLSCNIAFTEADYQAGGKLENGFLPFGLTLVHGNDPERPDIGDYYSVTPFTGTFDGGGHTIIGLKVDVSSTAKLPCNYAALFVRNNGTIKNTVWNGTLSLTSTDSSPLNTYYVAPFAALNSGTIENCANIGTVYGKASSRTQIGGMTGENAGTVKNCYNCGTLTCGNTQKTIRMGGIAGYTQSQSKVENCFTCGVSKCETSFSTKDLYVGDLIGYNNGVITASYALQYNTKILGRDSATAKVRATNTFKALTGDEAKLSATFTGFDFTDIWTMTETAPELKILYHTHSYGGWATVNSDSCLTKSYQYRICMLCNKVDTQYLTFGPHNWKQEYTVDTKPTCSAEGSESIHCALCEAVKEGSARSVQKTAHQPGKWKTIKAPTLIHTGIEEQCCTVCKTVLGTHVLAKLPQQKDAAAFSDVSKKDWFYTAVDYAYNADLFSGISKNQFAPKTNMSRAMFVTVLGRLYGVTPNHKVTTKFKDVKSGQWYTGYIKWAYENGIVSGISATAFAPEANVTREQICVMMAEYCAFAKIKLRTGKAAAFADEKQISSWAKPCVKKCQTAGLIGGSVRNGTIYFDPKNNATRAEVAQILYNFSYNYL